MGRVGAGEQCFGRRYQQRLGRVAPRFAGNFTHVARGHGASEEVALNLAAAFAAQKLKLGLFLDAFGEHGDADGFAQQQRGARWPRVGRFCGC